MEPPRDHHKYHLLKDLPRVMQWDYIKNMKNILELNDKFKKKYSTSELLSTKFFVSITKNHQKKQRQKKWKLNKLIDSNKSECEQKIRIHQQCVAILKDFRTNYRICNLKLKK